MCNRDLYVYLLGEVIRVIVHGGRRSRGRSNRTWVEALKRTYEWRIYWEDDFNQAKWKKRIHVADSKILG